MRIRHGKFELGKTYRKVGLVHNLARFVYDEYPEVVVIEMHPSGGRKGFYGKNGQKFYRGDSAYWELAEETFEMEWE